MSLLVADCPRCKTKKITFFVSASNNIGVGNPDSWRSYYEVFCTCKHCHKSTIFIVKPKNSQLNQFLFNKHPHVVDGALTDYVELDRFINIADMGAENPPEHLPTNIYNVFNEASKCLAIGCYNASAAMYRLCLDIATNELLPSQDTDGLNSKIRRSLGLRMDWVFNTGRLPEGLRDLSVCVKDDGNDGAHEGTLTKVDAEDLHDFTFRILERIYTEPARISIANKRREDRRQNKS